MDTLNMPSNENNAEPNNGAAGNAARKSHKLRGVLASAVAVAAVTSVVALCSGCNGQGVSPSGGGTNGSDSATTATSQEQATTPEAYEAPEADAIDDSDGLSIDDMEDEYGEIGGSADPEYLSDCIRNWMNDNNYVVAIVDPMDSTKYIINGSGGIPTNEPDNPARTITLVFGIKTDKTIEIKIYDMSQGQDSAYIYTTDTIPTADEALRIAESHLDLY